MTELKMVRELILIAILATLLGGMWCAVFSPESYGRWLQKIDTARFEMIDCDCTEPLE